LEKRYLRKDGKLVWGLVNASAVHDATGAVQSLIGQVQDITARKEAEAALRESESRFRALVQNSPDVIAIVDAAMQITYMSPSSLPAFGLAATEMVGTSVDSHLVRIHREDVARALSLFNDVATAEGATASTEVRIRHAELGWRWFQFTIANRFADPGVSGYLVNLRDITERKHAELATAAALKTQQAAIAELERLNRSKSRFLSTISHEFRTPLTAIIGYSEFMTHNAANVALVAEDAAVIHREASRLNRMVDEVLLIDRVDAGQMSLNVKPVDPNAIVRDVVESCRPLFEKHSLVLNLDPAVRRIDGDGDRLSQALTNLVSNAIKYSPDGGAIAIATRNEGDDVRISVRDEGIGIAPEDLERIFDRFERVETGIAGRIAGTGLGLSIVREIAKLHGGRVWAESDPGFGSVFSLAIPALRG
jgi:PAS domain S-box-containing protein